MQIREVEVRYKRSDVPLEQGQKFTCSVEIYRAFIHMWDYPVETFAVVCLDGKNRMLHLEEVAKGSLTASLAHPREIFFTAVKVRAAGIICLHNHPSGDPNPSAEDTRVTKRLVEGGKILGIRVLDHIIVGNGEYFSFADEGLL